MPIPWCAMTGASRQAFVTPFRTPRARAAPGRLPQAPIRPARSIPMPVQPRVAEGQAVHAGDAATVDAFPAPPPTPALRQRELGSSALGGAAGCRPRAARCRTCAGQCGTLSDGRSRTAGARPRQTVLVSRIGLVMRASAPVSLSRSRAGSLRAGRPRRGVRPRRVVPADPRDAARRPAVPWPPRLVRPDARSRLIRSDHAAALHAWPRPIASAPRTRGSAANRAPGGGDHAAPSPSL